MPKRKYIYFCVQTPDIFPRFIDLQSIFTFLVFKQKMKQHKCHCSCVFSMSLCVICLGNCIGHKERNGQVEKESSHFAPGGAIDEATWRRWHMELMSWNCESSCLVITPQPKTGMLCLCSGNKYRQREKVER